MERSRRVRLISGLVVLGVSVACGGGGAIGIGPESISVTLSPANPLVVEHGTLTFRADVRNDPSASGVSWSIVEQADAGTCASPADCGEISATRSASDAPVTFTAGLQSIHLKATSVADATKSATSTVIVAITPPVRSSITGTWKVTNEYHGANLNFTVALTEEPDGSINGKFSQKAMNGTFCWEPDIFGPPPILTGKRDQDSVAMIFSFPPSVDFDALELDIDGTLGADQQKITGTFALKGSCNNPTGPSILTRTR